MVAKACRLCPGRAVAGSSLCARCGGATRRPGTERARRALRRAINQTGSALCASCGVVFPAALIRVDHVRPLFRGGRDEPGNLQALCVRCHQDKTTTDAVGGVG
ncbi:HNH endonuclease [Actinokineospora baliensis]|uniref:HNH endonuclease n=1 Tax=Actinokineospora baliensis TaxID=547056 RepID=UPI0035589F42